MKRARAQTEALGGCDVGVADGLHAAEQFLVSLLEHRVVDRVLGVEVGVERFRAHPDALAQVSQRELAQALFADELPRGFEDLGSGRVPAFGPAVASRAVPRAASCR